MKTKTKIICTKCGSDNNELLAGGIFGPDRVCGECSHQGIFPEVTPKSRKIKNERKMMKDIKRQLK